MSLARILNTCIHFNGVFVNDSCKASVNYHEQFGNEVGCFKSIPCTRLNAEKTCPKAEYPTKDVAERELREDNAFVEKAVKASNQAHQHAKAAGLGVGNGGRGEMPCPTECGGTLRYSVASVNGHLHASCSTTGCLSWME